MTLTNRRFTLVRRPTGVPEPQDFALVEQPADEPGEGEFLMRNHYASIDPAMRGWMEDRPSYLPPIRLGDPVRSSTVGVVAVSRNPAFPVGAWATGLNAIEDYSVCKPGFTRLIDAHAAPSITNHLSVLGSIGLTAYFALLDAGQPKPGETVLVTGAAGAVGSLVGQIAKLKGCRTVGVAGGPAKCERLVRDYGYDAAIDYHGKSVGELTRAIRTAAPEGVDVHFENVGGEVLDAGLLALNARGRVVLCGLISEYNSKPVGARNLSRLIVQGARMQGFILTHYFDRVDEARPELMQWLNAGQLRVDEHIESGIENALSTFLMLFKGENKGKLILKIAE